jgi:hypothetical protein
VNRRKIDPTHGRGGYKGKRGIIRELSEGLKVQDKTGKQRKLALDPASLAALNEWLRVE